VVDQEAGQRSAHVAEANEAEPISSHAASLPSGATKRPRAASLAALRAAPSDEIVYCEECGVILVRTPESGL